LLEHPYIKHTLTMHGQESYGWSGSRCTGVDGVDGVSSAPAECPTAGAAYMISPKQRHLYFFCRDTTKTPSVCQNAAHHCQDILSSPLWILCDEWLLVEWPLALHWLKLIKSFWDHRAECRWHQSMVRNSFHLERKKQGTEIWGSGSPSSCVRVAQNREVPHRNQNQHQGYCKW
jgi:hypothetical protein